jgi:hypothetical protein
MTTTQCQQSNLITGSAKSFIAASKYASLSDGGFHCSVYLSHIFCVHAILKACCKPSYSSEYPAVKFFCNGTFVWYYKFQFGFPPGENRIIPKKTPAPANMKMK